MHDPAPADSLTARRDALLSQLRALRDSQARLQWLVTRARSAPGLPLELRTDDARVEGCLAKVWLVSDFRDGRCHFRADSESQIVKAIAGLLCEFYSGLPPSEILALPPDFLEPVGITQHLTANRRDALARIWERIRHFAATASKDSVPASATTPSP